jgi:acyl-CoA synthetase (AMP-forming)/AMP-acid ligase II
MINNEEETAPKNVIRFNEFISLFNGNKDFDTSTDFDESINIQFTSGTTGRPKAATLTQHGLVQNAYFCGKRALEGLTDKTPVICLPPPLYHCFGSVVGSLMTATKRGTLVLPASVHNPIQTLKAINDYEYEILDY